MNEKQSSRPIRIASVIIVAILAAVNLTAVSVSSAFTPSALTDVMQLTEPIEMMLRAYYGLAEDDFITPELIDGIKTLEISADRSYDGRILVEFTVNGEEGYARAVPAFALQKYWDSLVLPKLEQTADSVDEIAYYGESSDLLRATFDTSILSFYRLKDPYDCRLTQRAVEEMKLTYPVIRSKGSLYVFDSISSDCDLDSIYRIFDDAGLLDAWALDSTDFDASSLAYFTNLTEVRFEGINPIGCDLAASVKVVIE